MYKLVIKDDESNKTVIAFYRQEITIGREEGNTIRLTEQNVSRKHAKLTKSNNLIFLEDSKSYIGTFLNEEKIADRTQLNNGDEIKIGDYLITIINENEDNDETVLIKDDNSDNNDKRIKPVPISEITGNKSNNKDSIEDNLDVSYPLKPPYSKVVFQDSNLAGTSFDILKSVMTIGKSPEADIVITNKSFADIEAKIICNENSVKIKDVSNKNRLKINGDPYSILELRESDIISISSVSFRYCDKNSKYIYKSASQSKNNTKLFGIIGAAVIVLGIIIFIATRPSETVKKKEIKTNNTVANNTNLKDNTKNKKDTHEDIKKDDTSNDLSPELMNLLTTGKQLIKDRNWKQAEKVYVQILKMNPNNKNAKADMKLIKKELKVKKTFSTAIKLFTNKKYEKSIETFNSIPKESSYHDRYNKKKKVYFKTLIKLADAEILKKRYTKARDLLSVANEIFSDNKDVFDRVNFINKKSNKKLNRTKTNKNKTNKIKKTKKNRSLAVALVREGALLANSKPTTAIKKFKAAIKADSSYAQAYLSLGLAYKNIGKPSLAIKYLKIALKLNPTKKRFIEKKLKELK